MFFGALTREFGWGRAEGALGFSLFVLLYGLFGSFLGLLLDRFGPRMVMSAGALLLSLGFFLTSQITTLWQFYLTFGVISAFGFAAASWLPVVTILQSWFRRDIGLAVGIASAGVGVGIQILIPLEQYLITSIGWRETYQLMALAGLVWLLPIFFFMRRGNLDNAAPSADRSTATTTSAAAAPPADPYVLDHDWVGRNWTLRRAARTHQFWFLWVGLLLISASAQPLLAHQVVYMTDAGISPFVAATVAGFIGVASVPGKIGWGVLADRIGRELTYSIGLSVVIVAIVILWSVSFWPLGLLPYVYALLMGVGYAVTASLPPVVAADLFRGRSYGAIYGGLNLGSSLGTATGTWLAGVIFDVMGGYGLAFLIAIGCVVLGCLCIWTAAPRRVRCVPGRLRAAPPSGPAPMRSELPTPSR